ncbi:MAG: PucR family transcriptional regulator ligand-binding domain-containing protein [Actinobacteria bacterium]|nr:PucR family transcriptional regulator ligand-binding domain-containing protein [Actinomycetota bacterium]
MTLAAGPTVSEVSKALGLRLLARANAAERPISAVHVIELADPWNHLAAGELVLSNGLWHAGVEETKEYVRRLAEHGVVGLGYGLVREGEVVPDDVIVACEEAGLPLLEIKPEDRFVTVSEMVFERSNAGREGRLLRSLERSSRMVRALVASDRALETMVECVGEQLSCPVAIVSAGGRVECAVGLSEAAVGLPPEMVGAGTAMDVGEGMRLLLARPPESLGAEAKFILEHAVALVRVEMRRLEEAAEASGVQLGQLLDGLLDGGDDPAAARLQCRSLGIDLRRGVRVLVARLASGSSVSWTELPFTPASVRRGDELIVLLDSTDFERDTASIRAIVDVVAVGVGEGAYDPAALRRSWLEARRAAAIAVRLRDEAQPLLMHTDLGRHEILLRQLRPETIEAFRDSVLGSLYQYDATNGADLVTTVECFLACNCRWSETAKRLCVHENTLRYRISRIEELTGRSLSEMSTRVDFFLAVASLTETDGIEVDAGSESSAPTR